MSMELPIYVSNTPISVAWAQLISCLTSTKMSNSHFEDVLFNPRFIMPRPRGLLRMLLRKLFRKTEQSDRPNDLVQLKPTPPIQLLHLFPHPSRHHWFPSWTQVQQYPDVSVRDNDQDSDLVLVAGGMDYSLRIMSGRIYCGCSLQLIQPPTPETKAVYCCTMGGKDAQLVATVPGVELLIDTRSKYVLVDISPDRSLWPNKRSVPWSAKCKMTCIGHKHLPIWQESTIIICEEVDTLAQPAANTVVGVTKNLSAIMRYRLRRVTTLEWDCRLTPNSPIDLGARRAARARVGSRPLPPGLEPSTILCGLDFLHDANANSLCMFVLRSLGTPTSVAYILFFSPNCHILPQCHLLQHQRKSISPR